MKDPVWNISLPASMFIDMGVAQEYMICKPRPDKEEDPPKPDVVVEPK